MESEFTKRRLNAIICFGLQINTEEPQKKRRLF